MPVPRKKSPPPEGFTGATGADTTPLQLVAWAGTHANHSIALRMPDGVIGIDVDHYDKQTKKGVVAKRGADTVAEHEAAWGPLPATWTSTARGDESGPGPSRIAFYRVPPGRYRTALGSAGAVEIIQRHHRYAVVAPSPHPDADAAYRWYDPGDRPAEQPPEPDEFAELPPAWVAGLREGAAEVGPAPAPVGEGQELLAALLTDQRTAGGYAECAEVTDARQIALHEMSKADAGSRHDTAIARVHRLIHLGAAGHIGVAQALMDVGQRWAELTKGEDRAGEWERMLLTSARKAAAVIGVVPVAVDPCMVVGGTLAAAPAPVDDRGEADAGLPGPIAPAVMWSVRSVIGTHAFDPRGSLDQTLAQAVLERTYPALRYAYDSGQWLVRRQHVWESGGDLSRWAVGELAELMPHGDPDAHKDTLEHLQAARRKRFMSRGPAAGVAGKMVDLVVGGTHPCAVRMADLDAEPDVIWAGGVPWDIRASVKGCVPARISVDTPHLHSAGVAPVDQPTPLWDAFLAAVWPDREVRAWARRVLSVCVTGFSDKALPILLGQTDRGKSQVVVLLMSVLGTYAHAADPRLLAGADAAHASIVYALKGRRLSFIDEGPREGRWAQERLKQLTGGTELTGNRMRENPVTFAPTHTLVLTANEEPTLTDPAIRRRVRLIPCEGDPDQVRATRGAIGHLSSAAWRREAPGVLASMIREAAAWLADESSATTAAAPAQMRYLAEALAAEQDPIKAWVEEDTQPWAEGTKASTLYEAFVDRCVRQNNQRSRIPSVQKWGRELMAMGYVRQRDRNGSRWPLRLRDDGGWWTPGGRPVTDMAGPVTDDGRSHSVSVTPQNARSGSVFDGVVADVTDIYPPSTDTQKPPTPTQHTAPRTQDWGKPSFPPICHSGGSETGSDLREEGVTVSATVSATPPDLPQGEQAPPAEKIRDHASAQRDHLVSAAPAAEGEAPTAQVVIPAALLDAPEVVVLDLETGDAKTRHSADPTTFARIAGLDVDGVYSDTTDIPTVAAAVGAAQLVIGHNLIGFDLPVLEAAAPGCIDLLAMTRQHRVLDTMITEAVLDPPESDDKPKAVARAMARYGLDAIAARRGLPGKTDDLRGLATRHGGFDRIPVDDPEYRAYLRGDVAADKALVAVQVPYITPYVWREHRVAAIATVMSEAGLLADMPLLQQRYDDTEAKKRALAQELAGRYDIPITDAKGRPRKSPQATKDGKAAIVAAFHKLGVDDADLPRTPKGDYALGGDGMRELVARYGGDVAQLAEVVAGMSGSRTVYGTALDNVHADGRVHPSITMYQASGRWSTTKPGLTVFGKRGGRVVERAVFVAGERKVLLAADLSQIDARAIAVHSQDHGYMDLFLPGVDSHVEVAKMVWGDPKRRQDAKAIGHGWNYGMGLDKLAATAGVADAVAVKFDLTMQYQFPRLVAWRDWIREVARGGVLDNGFGRIMRCNPRRAYTQGPALMGQGTARDLMMECLLRLPDDIIAMLRIQVHDEIILEVPETDVDEVSAELRKAMTFEWAPPGASRPITVEADISGYGKSWADCYKK